MLNDRHASECKTAVMSTGSVSKLHLCPPVECEARPSMQRALIVVLAIFLVAPALFAVDVQGRQDESIRIGAIDYFGYAGLDLKLVKEKVPLKVGDELSYATFDREREAIQRAIKEATGKPATDVAAVCCDANRHLLIYIGLSGTSSRPLQLNPAPKGNKQLDGSALTLYEQYGEANQYAVRRGVSGEDDSLGYSLATDPAMRKVELAIRDYAVSHSHLLELVLENSASPKQRRVASCFLGYADRSEDQIRYLVRAANDADAEVRNNAIRALEVLASARNSNGIEVDPKPFIDLLSSGRWTDRNKSSMLLMRLTNDRNPTLLDALCRYAMAQLIEGARWSNPGHSTAFLLILGRVEGIPADRLWKLITGGGKLTIISMATEGQKAAVTH